MIKDLFPDFEKIRKLREGEDKVTHNIPVGDRIYVLRIDLYRGKDHISVETLIEPGYVLRFGQRPCEGEECIGLFDKCLYVEWSRKDIERYEKGVKTSYIIRRDKLCYRYGSLEEKIIRNLPIFYPEKLQGFIIEHTGNSMIINYIRPEFGFEICRISEGDENSVTFGCYGVSRENSTKVKITIEPQKSKT